MVVDTSVDVIRISKDVIVGVKLFFLHNIFFITIERVEVDGVNLQKQSGVRYGITIFIFGEKINYILWFIYTWRKGRGHEFNLCERHYYKSEF